ncbi:MAG: hypothetical protein DHS20C12_04450 [Pseudohongiella sp.]|nr:MAG: hypothetical protein DHS20C12_04450 [Pseudohongiella sp.]
MSESSSQSPIRPLAFLVELDPRLGRVFVLACAVALTLLVTSLFRPALTTLEENLGALGWTLAPVDEIEQRVTIVAIDERSLAEVGPWPWTRQQMANLVSAIDSAGAQLQLHDIVYAEEKAGDSALLAALQASRGAVLAQLPDIQSGPAVQTGMMTHSLAGISCDAASAGIQIPSMQNYVAANASLAPISKGQITATIASDGSVRSAPAVVCVEGAAYPSLAIMGLLEASGRDELSGSIVAGTEFLDPAQILTLEAYPGLEIPLDQNGGLRISYANLPSNYLAVSAIDVLNGEIEAGLLDNTWALVGATAFGSDDIVPTPYNGATHGVELQARILSSLLDVSIPYTPRSSTSILLVLALLSGLLMYGLAAAGGRIAAYGLPLAAVLVPLLSLSVHMQLLSAANIWLGWLFPAVYGLIAASALLLFEQSRVRVERGRVLSNLSSYLPSDVAREIAYTLPTSSVNAHRTNVTLLSADLRNFSAFGELRPPEESAAVLHFFFQRATEIVERHSGRIQEFKGDSLLAVWDAHDSQAAKLALAAAQEMQQTINQGLLQTHAPVGLEPLAIGIGIEQGPVLIGSIGPAHRRTHTMLGDTVAITLRIQEMTAELAFPILLGECIARQLNDLNLQSQGSYLLSGLTVPHVLYAPQQAAQDEEQADVNQPALKLLKGGRQ